MFMVYKHYANGKQGVGGVKVGGRVYMVKMGCIAIATGTIH